MGGVFFYHKPHCVFQEMEINCILMVYWPLAKPRIESDYQDYIHICSFSHEAEQQNKCSFNSNRNATKDILEGMFSG